MTLPEVQTRLLEIADIITALDWHPIARELRDLSAAISRRPYVRKAPSKSVRMTKQMRNDIFRCAMEHPDMSYQDIGFSYNVNAARVSEVVAGKRT